MAVSWAWLRLDLRRRWRSLLVLALLIALATATVMTAVAGAKRGASAVDRLLDQTLPATVGVVPNRPDFDWAAVRALPEVEALSIFVLTYTGFVVEELPPDAQAIGFPPADDEVMRRIERPVVLEGRLLDAARADEVVVSPVFAERSGLGVGDTVTLRLHTPETQDRLAFTDQATTDPDGPIVEARIVGVVRSQLIGDEPGDDAWPGQLLPSPGLFAQYEANLLGASGMGIRNAWVRLHGGEAAIPAFQRGIEEVSGRSDIDLINLAADARRYHEVNEFEANALLVFAVAAGVAALFLVGQSVARYALATVVELRVLHAVGFTPRQTRAAAALGPTIAALLGSIAGVSGTVVASRWFPIGTASAMEPDPGFDADVTVLATGGLATPVLVAGGAAAAAWYMVRSTATQTPAPQSVVAVAAARSSVPVPVLVGTRFALEPGRGRYAVPVRPALAGSILGVLGVVAAFTFSDGVDGAADHPERFGQVHHLEAFVGFDGYDGGPVDQVLPIIAADPDVVAVNDTRIAVAEVANVPVTLFSLDPVDTPLEPVVAHGRAPSADAEVALAPRSAAAMGVSVGDVVAMHGTRETRELTVTGLAFVPEGPHNNYVTGGWVTAAGYEALFDPDSGASPAFKYHTILISLAPGAEAMQVASRLEERIAAAVAAAGDDPAEVAVEALFEPPFPPSALYQVRQIRTMPVFLAGFLAILALGAVGHVLAMAVRKRRHDVAVLRAVGLSRTQSRGVVVTQATVLALVGLALGVPLGVALGRTVWRYVAETTPVFYVPPVALLALLLVVPVALVAANVLAAWPGHRAASLRVGHVLRSE